MRKKKAITAIFLAISAFTAIKSTAQTQAQLRYIEQWAPLAVEHQRLHGIPASITLAQGLLESAAGTSTLAVQGNNHFGIKCHRSWQRDSILSGASCYRRYNSPEESFADHSAFLKTNRYSALYSLDMSDYRGWARGLKQCGYATDPSYDTKLIAIIELCDLNKWSGGEALTLLPKPENTTSTGDKRKRPSLPATMHPVSRRWGLHCVKVVSGDTYRSIAEEFNLKLDKLLSFNDVEKKKMTEPATGTLVYLEKKNKQATEGHDTYRVKKGDTLWSIAQTFGISLKELRHINHLNKNDEVTEGDTLHLRKE